MSDYQLAEINIATMLAPLTDSIMAGFVNNLDRINALAEQTPGFVWRLQTPEGNATALRVFDSDVLIINMSVWESVQALYDYTYASDHVALFRQRRDWFEKMDTPIMCIWWIPAGHIPTPEEAKQKLEHLHLHGATPFAFTFRQQFTVEEMLALA